MPATTSAAHSDSLPGLWETKMPAVESDGVRLHYEMSGNPRGPVLVLANSLGSNLHMWDKVLPAFESSCRVLRYDMRGHGESGVATEPFTIEELGRDVLRLLDEVNADRASVCGLSLGGMVALWLGIHAPERVNTADFCEHGGAHRQRCAVGTKDRDGTD